MQRYGALHPSDLRVSAQQASLTKRGTGAMVLCPHGNRALFDFALHCQTVYNPLHFMRRDLKMQAERLVSYVQPHQLWARPAGRCLAV